MPNQVVTLTAGPEAVSKTVRRQCSLCAPDVALKALRHYKNLKHASRRRLGITRSTSVSSSLAIKAIDGVAPAANQTPKLHKKPQVLAPAGGWPQLRAAVENGADAVYLGLSDFNARARAVNFTPEELPEVMGYLHERGVKGYVTLNVLLFDEELQRAEQTIRTIACSGADAVIVQDIGVATLVGRIAPSLPIHASTQMSITSADGADFARQLGAKRVVVGRELSVADISKVSAGTDAEVEAFVHGALCVSYSGQCFSSEAWGGRSANRGQCAQACRMPYGLVVNGQLRDLADIKYLLSPQDLMALDCIPDMIRAGVSCFKIEGRLKGPEYVAITTAAYRAAVDSAWADITSQPKGAPPTNSVSVSAEQRRTLHQVFARGQDEQQRGLTPGFLEGPQHQRLVRGRAPRHRGVLAGRVVQVDMRADTVAIDMLESLKRGDGLVFDSGAPDDDEEGGTVYNIQASGGRRSTSGTCVELSFGPRQLELRRIKAGDLVWRNKDPAVEAQARASYESLSSAEMRKVPVDASVSGSLGQALTLRLFVDGELAAEVDSAVPLQAASSIPLSEAALRKALGTLGSNSLSLQSLDLSQLDLSAGLFIPLSELKALRRAAASRCLEALRQRPSSQGLSSAPVLPSMLEHIASTSERSTPTSAVAVPEALNGALNDSAGSLTPHKSSTANNSSSSSTETSGHSRRTEERKGAGHQMLHNASDEQAESSSGNSRSGHHQQQQQTQLRLLCRTMAQVQAACQVPWLEEVILDFLEVHGLKEAVGLVKQAGKRCIVCTPRVLKPGEERLANFYLRLQPDALLIRSAGMLQQMNSLRAQGGEVAGMHSSLPELQGDFSLNAANTLSADLLLRKGLQRLAPTHDLNAAQLAALGRSLGRERASRLEAIVHQHLPIFHTEHCVFCRFLSEGNSYLDCGHPCESNSVHLRDNNGKDHLVLADEGCRNTVFNAQAQSGLWHLKALQAAGYGSFRIELVDEPAEQVRPLLEAYRDAMSGERSPGEVWRWLGSLATRWGAVEGITVGSLEVKSERLAATLKPTAAARR